MKLRLLLLALLIRVPAAHARLWVAPVPAAPGASALVEDLAASLERSGKYDVLNGLEGFRPSAPACPAERSPDFILAVETLPPAPPGKKAKPGGRVRIFDCKRNVWLPGAAEARSSKPASLAASLKEDIAVLVPFMETVGLDGAAPCLPGGTAEELRTGSRLWWTSPEGTVLGRFVVAAEAPETGCARLDVAWRTGEGRQPRSGDLATARSPGTRPPRLYAVPRIGRLETTGPLPDLPGTDAPPQGFLRLASLPENESAWTAAVTVHGGPVSLVLNGRATKPRKNAPELKSGYGFSLDRNGWKLTLTDGGRKTAVLGSGRTPRWKETPGGTLEISAVRSGRWLELYIDGRFVTGLDDETLHDGELFIAETPGTPPPASAVMIARGGGVQPLD